ncbi:MAG: DUF4957 domain-containing protein [Paludibacteraceae bacterium]|nr:DUF4957 domain-containing protein [Paludibacteraceae bacterium]
MKKIFLFVAALCATIALNATVFTLEPGENVISAAVASAQAGDVIELTGDHSNEYTESGSFIVDKAITLRAAIGTTPLVHMPKIKMNAAFAVEGIEFYGYSDYLFRCETGGDFEISFKNCVIHDNPAYFIYISSGQTINALTIDGCIFYNNSKEENAVVNGSGTIGNFVFKNSTVYNISGKYALRIQHYTTATIDHCTFYNCGERPILMAENDHTAAAVSNVVVANPSEVTSYCIATYAGTVDNCVYYNTGSGAHSGPTVTNLTKADPKFINAAEGNFNWASDSPLKGTATDGSNIGDPRWTEATAELVFSFNTPAADYEEAMNDYTIQFAAVVPEGTAQYTISYSYDQQTWEDIVKDITYTNQTECIFHTRGLAEGEVTLRGILATDKDTATAYSKILNIVRDTRPTRPIANLDAQTESTSAALTWKNPTHEIPVMGSLLGEENLLELAKPFAPDGDEAVLAEENDAVKMTITTSTAWHQTGIEFDVTSFENVQNVAFKIKGDGVTQIEVMLIQDGLYWWASSAFVPGTDWETHKITTFKHVDWRQDQCPYKTFDGNHVTGVAIEVNNGTAVTDAVFYIDSVMVEGLITPCENYDKTIIRGSINAYPQSINDGDSIYEGIEESCVATIDPTKTYYYAAFALDDLGNVSEPTYLLIEGEEVTHTLFNVTVPAGTEACYIVGSFCGWAEEDGIEMTKVDDTHYTYQAAEDMTGVTYRYYHGDDSDMAEVGAEGQTVTRTVNAAEMNDEVVRWNDGSTRLNTLRATQNATKMLHKGRLIIRANNVLYNAVGTAL